MAGRPQARTQITDSVLPMAALAAVDVRPGDLYELMTDKLQWLQWLAWNRLIRNTQQCHSCERPMSLCAQKERSDGYSWRCRPCSTRCSVRTGSFFANCDTPTEKIVMMMFYWLVELKSTQVMFFERVTNWDTIVNYKKRFRQECYNWSLTSGAELGGFDANGKPVVVEVDESGHIRHDQWVVGLVERDSGRCWFEVVPERDAPTLERIIIDHVLPGTRIVTGNWQGYSNVGKLKGGIYDHAVVLHDSADSDIHTRTIKGMLMLLKRKRCYQSDTSCDFFRAHFAEFQWRHSHKEQIFGHYLQLLCHNFHI